MTYNLYVLMYYCIYYNVRIIDFLKIQTLFLTLYLFTIKNVFNHIT